MTDVSKYLRVLSPLIINDVFTLRNCQLFERKNLKAVRYELETRY